jgi:hypothetical protein
MLIIFCDFCLFSAKKLAFFSKNQCYDLVNLRLKNIIQSRNFKVKKILYDLIILRLKNII